MIITVASFKGGVAKSTTAVHLATFLNQKAPALLIDGDPNRSVTNWGKRGKLPFKVIDERQAAMFAGSFEHVVIDTQARPEKEDLEALAQGCDLLILPTTPDVLALDALTLTVDALRALAAHRFKVLLTVVPPRPSRDGEEARIVLEDAGLPVFKRAIRRYSIFQKASLLGVPVCDLNDQRSREAWDDYVAVGKEILDEQKQVFSGVRIQGSVAATV
jgi:chromosome partitioning protein